MFARAWIKLRRGIVRRVSRSKNLDTISYCLSRNEDIAFVASQMHLAIASHRSVLLVPRGFKFGTPVGGLIHSFRSVDASSLAQIVNARRILVSMQSMAGGQNVLLLSPSIWNIPLAVAARALGKNLEVAMHDVIPHYQGIRGFLYRFQNRVLMRLAQRVWVFSEFSRRAAESQFCRASISVLPLPSPAELIREECLERGGAFEYDFAYFGRREAYKGASLLPQFAARLEGLGLSLLVVGRFESASELSQILQSRSNVTFIDKFVSSDKLGQLLMESRACICPYLSATQSGVIAFANCLGVPTLAHDVGGLSEQIWGEFGGLTVNSSVHDDWITWFRGLRLEDRSRLRSAYDLTSSSSALRRSLVSQLADPSLPTCWTA
jgi:glycosyltransferase involved in cell wall biosynthesis